MNGGSMDDWQSDFAAAQARLPCWLSRLARPRLIFLPSWWPAPVGAWAYLHMVFIGPALRDAPADVRRYVIGHEYGHIQANHTVLHFFYWCAALGFLVAVLGHMPALGAWSCLVLAVVSFLVLLPPLARGREYQADAVAALLYGQETALRGALWMADKTGTISNAFRRSRLRRLGWKEGS